MQLLQLRKANSKTRINLKLFLKKYYNELARLSDVSINRFAIFDHAQKSMIFDMVKQRSRALKFVAKQRIELLNFSDIIKMGDLQNA